jgi:Spy/CpxP family protein refolding chaperone
LENPVRKTLSYTLVAIAAGICAAAVALAQGPASPQPASPYVPIQGRDLKAVSPERVTGLLEARGLGYALTAELNSYPGPMHVLELADGIQLTKEQAARTSAIMEAMKAEGRVIGARIVDAETHLERMFRMGHIDQERLRAQTAAVGALEADLRRAHLAAHLEMRTLLTTEQVAAYDRLRGYGAGRGPSGAAHGQPQGHSHGQGSTRH